MLSIMSGRRRTALAATVALALVLAGLAARPLVARAVRARIEAEAARRGLVAHVDGVRVGPWPPLRLTGVAVEKPGGWRLTADTVEARWFGRTRLDVGHALFHGPAGLTVAALSTTWDVLGAADDAMRFALGPPQAGMIVSRTSGADGSVWALAAHDLPMGRLLDVRRFDRPLLDGGTIRGTLTLETSAGGDSFDLDLAARSARLPALAGEGPEHRDLGDPTELAVQATGTWKRVDGTLDIPRWRATISGAAVSGALAIRDLDTDPGVDLSLDVERVEFARLLDAAGLEAPGLAAPRLETPKTLGPAAAAATTGTAGGDLGSASLALRAQGRLADPASFVVTQRLVFTPPGRLPPAIERLRGGFTFEAGLGTEAPRTIDVSPASPDFIPLAEVPPLFLRTLLLGEDAGFYSHPGIDFREVPAALLTDWARGGAARGASTITQQLAKNLFLSSEKNVGRKLQEVPLTLLLESALGKSRILEIYLNVIEWGPGLYGLKPAARTYFDREPKDLTPAQMAFLVSLIPGPVKYQSSFAHGTPGPGFRQLVDALLAKLRSVDAIDEEDYRRALEEQIVVRGREPAAQGAG